jgi:glucosamine--fructose-6-phosphate aminotransferase (isomerizing)
VLAQTPEGTALVCARHGPPLAVGWNAEGAWLASDVLGILPYTTSDVYLEDGDVASLRPGRVEITDLAGRSVHRPARIETWDPQEAGNGH